jgi:hypothetical protein
MLPELHKLLGNREKSLMVAMNDGCKLSFQSFEVLFKGFCKGGKARELFPIGLKESAGARPGRGEEDPRTP